MGWSGRLCALGGIAVLFCCARVRADEPRTARLHYERSEQAAVCPEQRELENAVAARLGYVPFTDTASDAIDIRVERRHGRYEAELSFRGARGQQRKRELSSESSDCRELTEAMALAVSLAIDPLSLTRSAQQLEPPPPAEPEPLQKPPAPSQKPPEPPPPVVVSAAPPLHLSLLAGASGLYGVEPAPSLGGWALIGARREQLGLDLHARVDLPRTKRGPAGGQVRAAARAVGVALCRFRGAFQGCGVFDLLFMQADATGLPDTRSGLSIYGVAGLRGAADYVLGRGYFTRFALEVGVALTRSRFELMNREVWETSRLQGQAMLGIGKEL